MRQHNKKLLVGVVAAAVFLGLIVLTVYLKSVWDYKQAVQEISIGDVRISDVADGVYIGECNVNFIYAKVEVTVQNKEIEKIRILEHKNERGQVAETIVDQIVSEQKIDVDAISGATNSSKVIKKAVENALENGLQYIFLLS